MEKGCVPQRYCLAILQKFSVRDDVIPLYVQNDLIYWNIDMINYYIQKQIHVFCPVFCSAMLANIIRTHSTVDYLEKHEEFTKQV